MKYAKRTITFKVIIGYIILGVLATISGFLIFHEIKTFTSLQKEDITDRSKIIRAGSLIADIYENESLARAAIQLKSSEKFDEYVFENEQLILKIDSLRSLINSDSQQHILDSIKVYVNQKFENIKELKELKTRDNADESINKAINKLTSIDSHLGKVSINDLVKNPDALDKKTRLNFEEYVKILNKYSPRDSIKKTDQIEIDSLLSVSKSMLKDVQIKSNNQRVFLQKKESELIQNDLIIFRKLQQLLSALERDIVDYSNVINQQRELTINRSKNIILASAAISFIVIIIFSIIILNEFRKTQRYRKQLEEANETTSSLLKSREQLISMVSHDLRTPLSTITGFSELLQQSVLEKKDKNYIEHISSASNYMGKLVDDLLEFSKLENGNITIESIAFNLENHIEEIVQHVKNSVKNKPVEFILEHDQSIENLIITDPFRLKQVLFNLVINAYKFTNEGSITISSLLKQEVLEIKVSDTGVGINDNQKEHIFKEFAQADNNQNSNDKGFGLGLTISKKLVEILGGDLTLESELNKGSIFTLKIPVKRSNKPLNANNTSTEVLVKPIFNLKAIVVEDDASMRKFIHDVLKQYGIQAYVFGDAKNALDEIKQIDFDFVLTDIQLPKMNGIHFMEILKTDASYKNQPIIAMTGRAKMSTKDYLNSGFSEVILKPFNSSKIQHVLESFFSSEGTYIKEKRITEESIEPEGFSIVSLSTFFNNDTDAVKGILTTFLDDTKKNYELLVVAKNINDIETINSLSHKMLTMFKQLSVDAVIPFLETFELRKTIENNDFEAFKKELEQFIKALENYIN
ncbi:ATP-binding protein [Algibacter miyuki]|uniref:histidine kinase n=1 Tax=Algibacter miyuki TaxID=1306933 RepID=A0ABV5GVH4_9FLAO|nr:ATP-binding protein [Algibacter miyuki]MDN3664962.1 ATP-binding protein [Algibacter miyuki]